MKRLLQAAVLLVFSASLALAQFGPGPNLHPSKNEPQLRELAGQVTNNGDLPLPNAIVYLNNPKTLAVRTFVADQNGNYRFPGLARDVDYEVFAEYHGKKSDRKTLSSFDSRPQPHINLKIDVGGK